MDIRHTISYYQEILLSKRGATVARELITDARDALWKTVSHYQKILLIKRDQLAQGGGGGGGSGNNLVLDGKNLILNGKNLVMN